MRSYRYVLEQSKSSKSVSWKTYVDDSFGNRVVDKIVLLGWRADVAKKYLMVDKSEWDEDLARKLVCIMLLRGAADRYEGVKFITKVREASSAEIHFWAYQFLTNKRAVAAWKILNGRDE